MQQMTYTAGILRGSRCSFIPARSGAKAVRGSKSWDASLSFEPAQSTKTSLPSAFSSRGAWRLILLPARAQDLPSRDGLRRREWTAAARSRRHPGRRSREVPEGRGVSVSRLGNVSTAEDLLHVYRMMMINGVYEGKRYLSPYSVHLMTEAHTAGIDGVGWMRGSDYGLGQEMVTDPLGGTGRAYHRDLRTQGLVRHPGLDRPANKLISVLVIQCSDAGTGTMVRTFLGMAEAAPGKVNRVESC
jgi:hypothetical protein